MDGCNRGINYYDEELVVYGASRILDGNIPYRDYWTTYPPGQQIPQITFADKNQLGYFKEII